MLGKDEPEFHIFASIQTTQSSVRGLFFVTIASWQTPPSSLFLPLKEKLVECSELLLPENAVLFDPFLRLQQRFARKLAMPRAARLLLGKKPGLLEHANVLHHRRQRHAVRFGKFADRSLTRE